MGNHDLTENDSFELWRDECLRRPNVHMADTVLRGDACDVIAINTWWMHEGQPSLRWQLGTGPIAALPPSQLDWLDAQLRDSTRRTILAMHSQLAGIPPLQTGQPNLFEPPTEPFASTMKQLLQRHPHVELVLGGHSHVQCSQHIDGRRTCTGTSLTEVPFQYTIIDVNAQGVSLSTRRLPLDGAPSPRPDRQWVMG